MKPLKPWTRIRDEHQLYLISLFYALKAVHIAGESRRTLAPTRPYDRLTLVLPRRLSAEAHDEMYDVLLLTGYVYVVRAKKWRKYGVTDEGCRALDQLFERYSFADFVELPYVRMKPFLSPPWYKWLKESYKQLPRPPLTFFPMVWNSVSINTGV